MEIPAARGALKCRVRCLSNALAVMALERASKTATDPTLSILILGGAASGQDRFL
jgi:hypothetical protein